MVEKDPDPFSVKTEAHEAFLKAKAESVLGRGAVIKQVSCLQVILGLLADFG